MMFTEKTDRSKAAHWRLTTARWRAAVALLAVVGGMAGGGLVGGCANRGDDAAGSDGGTGLRMASVFSDHMVLQRSDATPMWGWTAPRARVVVRASWGDRLATRADGQGRWRVELDTPDAGGPYELRISSGGDERVLRDIMVGEVWLASGQSNMEWPLQGRANGAVNGSESAIAGSADSLLRMYTAERSFSGDPQEDVPGGWKVSSPETAGGFSAVGYFFARELRRELGVPVGIVHTSWGGTPIESWMPIGVLESVPGMEGVRARFDSSRAATERYRAWQAAAASADTSSSVATAPAPAPPPSDALLGHRSPSVLYNAMIHPLLSYGIRGAIWYQGESNVWDPPLYADLFPAMIQAWREQWGQGAFPFYFVQIAPYDYDGARDELSPWLRHAQTETLDRVPETGMAVTMDIGDPGNIHPSEKFEVGRRLSLLALAGAYGREEVVASGPRYEGFDVDGSQAVVRFTDARGGLRSPDATVSHMELAGLDGRFVPARAVIDGDRLRVSASGVERPTAVRYAWSDTAAPNLFNAEGLPAVPFHSGSWEAFEPPR